LKLLISLLILGEIAGMIKFMLNDKKDNLKPRPPIIVILGHVDHGKTTLLDYLRKSNIAQIEPGQITQNIGAFPVEFQKKLFIFIDTPGHEAFLKVRSCGVKAADIAILLIAADEGVKEQTKEAYELIKSHSIPFLVALNKVDKPEKQIEKVKKQLSEMGILIEQWGGNVPCQEISAKTGQGIKEMLEVIDLMAQINNIGANPDNNASGVVITSQINAFDGISAGIIIKDGTLNLGDYIVSPSCFVKVVSMVDFTGAPIKSASPSTPLKLCRLKCRLSAGEKFYAFKPNQQKQAQDFFNKLKQEIKPEIEQDQFNVSNETEAERIFLIIKASEQNNLDAVLRSLEELTNPYVKIKVVRKGLGDISSVDIEEALLLKAIIYGFQVKIPASVKLAARNQGVEVAVFDVIYDLLKSVKEKLIEKLPEKIIKDIVGSLQILKIFKTTKDNKILFGGKVLEGKVVRGFFYEVAKTQNLSDESAPSSSPKGKIIGLQQDKIDVEEVLKGRQCGILGENLIDLQEGQVINIFSERREKLAI